MQALEWWYDSAEGKLAAQQVLPVPPPPPALPTHPDGLPLPADAADCAVCRRQRTNPALLEVHLPACFHAEWSLPADPMAWAVCRCQRTNPALLQAPPGAFLWDLSRMPSACSAVTSAPAMLPFCILPLPRHLAVQSGPLLNCRVGVCRLGKLLCA